MIQIDDNATAFDVAIALWTWLSEWHEGMMSDKYAAMSKLTGEYKLENIPSLDEMTEFWYNQISEDNWEEVFNEFCLYMDNCWDLES